MDEKDPANETLVFKVCDCAKCRNSVRPIGRLYRGEEVYDTFCCQYDGQKIIGSLLQFGIISGENAVELCNEVHRSRVFLHIPENTLGVIGAKTEFMKNLPHECDEEARLHPEYWKERRKRRRDR